MATNNRMALLEQLSKCVVEKDKDFLKEALTLLINALMDAEVTSIIGAEKYERNNNRNKLSQWISPKRMGHSSWNITVKHSQVTSRELFSKSFRTEENVRESIIECSPGSLCSWSKYQEGG